eukprot:7377188-Prymnesium_polylepis.1
MATTVENAAIPRAVASPQSWQRTSSVSKYFESSLHTVIIGKRTRKPPLSLEADYQDETSSGISMAGRRGFESGRQTLAARSLVARFAVGIAVVPRVGAATAWAPISI